MFRLKTASVRKKSFVDNYVPVDNFTQLTILQVLLSYTYASGLIHHVIRLLPRGGLT